MRGKADLFNLIQKMSRSEKRYFTLDAQKGGSKGSKYLKLFQAINGMDEYDETKLKKKFPKNLSADKSYLYDAILRSMRDYRSSKSYAAQIKEKLLDFRYLHELGLYDQCEERLREAKELAEELGSTNALLEINYEERRLSNDLKRKGYEEEVERLITEKDEYLEDLKLDLAYLDLYNWILPKTLKRKEFQNQEQIEKLVDTFDKRFQKIDQIENLPPRAEHRKLQCLGLYYLLTKNSEQMYQYFKSAVDWWTTNLKYQEEEYYRYKLDVSNLVYASFVTEKLHDIPKLLDILESDESVNSHTSYVGFQNLANYRIMYYINTGDFKNAPKFIDKVSKEMENVSMTDSANLVIISNIAFLHFIMENYDKCLEWADKIIKGNRTDFRHDVQKAIRILSLIANYEEDNIDRLELAIRAYSRYYNEKTGIERDDFEFRMLDFAKKLISTTKEFEILEELKNYLSDMKKNPAGRVPAGIDDLLLLWIESKRNFTSISKIIAERAETLA